MFQLSNIFNIGTMYRGCKSKYYDKTLDFKTIYISLDFCKAYAVLGTFLVFNSAREGGLYREGNIDTS